MTRPVVTCSGARSRGTPPCGGSRRATTPCWPPMPDRSPWSRGHACCPRSGWRRCSSRSRRAVARLLRDEPSGVAEERRRYLVAQTSVATRDRRLTAELRDLYAGTCQLCGWAPRRSYGVDLCEAHHVRWLSRGAGTSWPTWCWSAPTTTAPSTDWTRRSTTAPAASCSGQARNVSAACSMS